MGSCCGKKEADPGSGMEYDNATEEGQEQEGGNPTSGGADGSPNHHTLATFAGGCFWCIEAAFKSLKGVSKAVSGFAGGQLLNPKYEQVSHGNTGHAESVQVTFDESEIPYSDLVEMFWRMHDPTTLDKQGNDFGTEYRSIIFYHNNEQRLIAIASKAAADEAHLFNDPIVTDILPATKFYPADSSHQNYFARNPQEGYCQVVIGPKLKKFKQLFKDKLK